MIREHLLQSADIKRRTADKCTQQITHLAKDIVEVLKTGNKILIFGNGGSAADAQHFAAELVVKYKSMRKAWPAIALTTDSSVLTAIGNDFGFDDIFSRQVQALGEPGDVVIGISTSGTSRNVVEGILCAQNYGLTPWLLTGKVMTDFEHVIAVPSKVTAHIQEAHIAIIHAVCEYVDAKLIS